MARNGPFVLCYGCKTFKKVTILRDNCFSTWSFVIYDLNRFKLVKVLGLVFGGALQL